MIQSDSHTTSSLNISRVYLLDHEIAASAEALDVQTHAFEVISDDEEDIEILVAAGKRPAVNSDDEEDSDTDEFTEPDKNRASPLPNFPDTQHRASGRIRKKSRLLDGYIA
ncbi:hypothetical protein N7447_009709 [Penicillium robsamsonii]|uniref:uncharacterized protein n=1 Tax=Penicillium robsamsonii TaxID=1792511 RepID=UPI0025499FE9|nr:uncharacterized protein N7447_009709 [Penicillium robsamsonii]KAJ5817476.1 hypothetical protein N7447_009709 [Penicillium robsamsonii]